MAIHREPVLRELECSDVGALVAFDVLRGYRVTIRASSLYFKGSTQWMLEIKKRVAGRWVSFSSAKTMTRGGTVEHAIGTDDLGGASEIGVFNVVKLSGTDGAVVEVVCAIETDVVETLNQRMAGVVAAPSGMMSASSAGPDQGSGGDAEG